MTRESFFGESAFQMTPPRRTPGTFPEAHCMAEVWAALMPEAFVRATTHTVRGSPPATGTGHDLSASPQPSSLAKVEVPAPP